MNIFDKELTPHEEATMALFSVLMAILTSEHTPEMTKHATLRTLKHHFESEDSPWGKDESLGDMANAMITILNRFTKKKMKEQKRKHQKAGNDILNNINWN